MPGVPLIGPLMAKVFGTRNERFVKRHLTRVEQITALEPEFRLLTDAQLRAKTDEFKKRYADGETETDMLIEIFAVAREVMDRSIGIRNIFDPALGFDPSVLPAAARTLYDQTKATIAATPDAEPTGELLGNVEPVPAWKLVAIPVGLYDAVRELHPKSKPPYRARPFDVQLIGGMVLAEHKYAATRSAMRGQDVYFGAIAEMKTGEGKTIVAPLACYLHRIAGRQIHVVTVNTYLVRRDREWTFPFFYHLGVTVGYIAPYHELADELKKAAYRCNIVYGTTSEFGFDYLRDNMKLRVEDQVQKRREFAIVDEVDSTLIDEARTPLIISGPAHDDSPRYQMANKLAAHLVEIQKPWAEADKRADNCKMRIKGLEGDMRNARDKEKIPPLKEEVARLQKQLPDLEDVRDRHVKFFEVEMDKKQVHLEHEGIDEAQGMADIGSFYVGDNIDMPHLLEQALRAHVVYECDKDYVVKEGQVIIVDQFTGRLMVGRQWSDGLHQAVEVKEGVEIKPETQTMATITIQNFYKLYQRLAGMTGTADTEAQEFHDIYNMDVVVIPTNEPVIRDDFNDRIYLSEKDKWNSIVEEIKTFHDLGRPILVGTTSVEKSEYLSQRLTKKYGIQHEVLNAKQHESEAHIIENAGALGAVMVATNMAGRGTDIKLQPVERQDLINHWKRRGICPKQVQPADDDDVIIAAIHRHLAEKQLGMKHAEAQDLDEPQIVRQLLEYWAEQYTLLDPKKIPNSSDQQLRQALDEGGNFLMHRIAIWKSTEELGGLHVIGTERHESRRIDNQLRGRSGRQGDQGSSRFFISLEDDLMKMFAGETTNRVLSRLGMKEGDSIEHPMLTKAVERAQRKVEERNFEIRKSILEYDEVMDHQRHDFYGRRQRILEGKGLREIVMEYIREAVIDACERYLSDDFVPTCIAEWVLSKLDVSIEIDRLRLTDQEDLFKRIRVDATEDVNSSIGVTIGEFMNEDAEPDDWDTKGLIRWAKSSFGLQLKASAVRRMTPREVMDLLSDAAKKRIDDADLSDLNRYLVDQYRERELAGWANSKFLINVDIQELLGLETPDDAIDFLMQKAEEAYREREARYPVEYALDMTNVVMAQNPVAALQQLASWAKQKFDVDWDESYLRTHTPQQWRENLMAESRAWSNGKLESTVDQALAQHTDDDALAGWLEQRFGLRLGDDDRGLSGDDRRAMLRDRIQGLLRSELTLFERFVLLQVLDQSWKDHLYFMDQLRNAIGFRSFAQQDPRIEYRREGRRQYDQMGANIRDKVTDLIFKAKMTPQQQPRSRFAQAQPVARPGPTTGVRSTGAGTGATAAPSGSARGKTRRRTRAAAGRAATPAGSSTATATAPGTTTLQASAQDVAAQGTARQRADLEAARRAGGGDGPGAASGGGGDGRGPAQTRQTPIVKRPQSVGRNDPCPCGSGKKYKKCCGKVT